ncbi:glycerophosphodiester phosphodiesterase family protein [Bifidobacterium sp. ESL0732]|uniref:glycerophosphodiester phosphodiesterase family protein n=1 Tax=Bifidobacterium sp. ESL0732 TaxID=2983222 RepID=UPI0023F86D69|nr:glycerophosphodiester phosphodiesterase family protein [Bifidobacterium sp. ESL0732]WEV63578.1 glycerophosphodiester phosphodiesterase family protein [Bifidobacterium sp. ESL0732]
MVVHNVTALKRHSWLGSALRAGVLAAGFVAWAMAPRSSEARRRNKVPKVPDVLYAHRGLHDVGSGLTSPDAHDAAKYVAFARKMARQAGFGNDLSQADADDVTGVPIAPENSLPAFAAACEAGFGIELDLHLTADHQVVVVHDSELMRVAGDSRRVEDLNYEELCQIPLFPSPSRIGDSEAKPLGATGTASMSVASQHVPLFTDVLHLVAGRVPIVVEYKFDHQGWRSQDNELMERGNALLREYEREYHGSYVVESFNAMAMRWYRNACPDVCRGQLSNPIPFPLHNIQDLGKVSAQDWRTWVRGWFGFDWLSRPDFAAYEWHGFDTIQMSLVRRLGAEPVTYTIHNEEELSQSAQGFDRFIFEAFVPKCAR